MPNSEHRSLGRRLQDHWLGATVILVAAIATILVAAIAVTDWWSPPSPLPVVVNPNIQVTTPPQDTLEIMDIEMKSRSYPEYILWIIPLGKDYYHTYDVTIQNHARIERSECQIVVQFVNLNGGEGWETLFKGSWLDWARGTGASPFFTIPSDPGFKGEFFAMPSPREYGMSTARAYVICAEPEQQVSRWHDVDLSRAGWPDGE